MHTYEILELLLTYAIPRRDTKPIAKRLLKKFGTLHGVLQADPGELTKLEGLSSKSAVFLLLIGDIIGHTLHEKYTQRSFIGHRRDVEAHLRYTYGARKDEFTAAVFLDGAHSIIKTEIVAQGTVNKCTIYPRTMVEKAIRCGAAALILAHNHPGGTTSPSPNDWNLTYKLREILSTLEIEMLDHLILCRDKVVSLREMPEWPR